MSIAQQFRKPKPVKTQKPTMRAIKPEHTSLDINLIRRDDGTQSRESIDKAVAFEYSEDVADGVIFPPVTVFYDGTSYWLADGYHRVEAHILAGKSKIVADLRQGSLRDAILHSVGANATHGLKRSRKDKYRAVVRLLSDGEWSLWSDRAIARQCNVDGKTVAQIRVSHLRNSADGLGDQPSEKQQLERKVERSGSTYTMNTTAIGTANRPSLSGSVPDAEATSNLSALKSEAAKEPEPDHRQQIVDGLPQEIKDRQAAKAQAIEARKSDGAAQRDADRIAELEENVRVLEAEAEALRAENKLYGEMRVQFEQGGFDKVIAGKENEIRALETRVYSESADKAAWHRASKFWKEQALKLGYVRNPSIDIDPVEVVNG